MKKYIICLWLLGSLWLNIDAQKLSVKDICELTSDITARTKVQLDNNGHECALVRVNIPSIRNVEFKGEILSSSYLPGEYVLYIPEDTKSIDYFFDGYSGQIDFSEFGINVRGKSVYRCTLKKNNTSQNCKLRILSEPESAIVIIDGIPKGETPLFIDDLSAGEHVITIPNTIGYSLPEKRIILKEGENQDLLLNLIKTPLNNSVNSENDLWYKYKKMKANNKVGIVDIMGNVVVPCQFDKISSEIQDGYFLVWEDHKCGLYKIGKGVVVQPQYYDISTNLNNRFVRVSIKNNGIKFGYIDLETGREVIPCQLITASDLPVENYFVVETTFDKYGYLKIEDGKLKVFIEPQFVRASNFENGIALVRIKQQTGDVEAILDTHGNIKVLPSYYNHDYDWFIGFSEGLCSVSKNMKYGFINYKGEEVIPCVYDGVKYEFRNGGAVVIGSSPDGAKRGRIFISNRGEVFGNQDNIDLLSDEQDYYVFKDKGKEGIIRKNGEVVVPAKYEKCKILRDGWVGEFLDYFSATESGICDLYDCRGKKLFSFSEDLEIVGCKDGFVMVKDPETQAYGYANLSGDLIASCIYHLSETIELMMNYEFAAISDGLAMLVLGDKYGFIDNTGKIVVPVKYDGASPFKNGIGYVREGNQWIEIQKKQIIQ